MRTKVNPNNDHSKLDCVHDLIQWLIDRDLFDHIAIYASGLCYTSEPSPADRDFTQLTIANTPVFITDEPEPQSVVEYFDPNLINMTFEGMLYDILNLHSETEDQLRHFFKSYGLDFDYNYSWSLSAYPLN